MSGAGRRGRRHINEQHLEQSDEDPVVDSGSFYHRYYLVDPEQWYDAWSEELVTTYHILKEHCNSQGLPFLEDCSFSNFIDFAFRHSSKRPPTW
jgi:hypothetical protein